MTQSKDAQLGLPCSVHSSVFPLVCVTSSNMNIILSDIFTCKLCVSSAPHIEDLVLLPSPVLRLLNLIDDSHLHNEEEYEGTTV